MPSKKKNNNKARKGAKKAKEQQGTPDTQMQRLKIDEDSSQADEDALLEKAIKLAAAEKEALEAATAEQDEQSKKSAETYDNGCDHGYVKTPQDHFVVLNFAKTFMSELVHVVGSADMGVRFQAAEKAVREKHPEVWSDPSQVKLVVSYFIAKGTQYLLRGMIENARDFAFLAFYLEEYIAVHLHRRKAEMDVPKLIELLSADEHTLVKYLRKRIPCACLDGKYKEVKSVAKMGLCFNLQCHVPDRMVERRTMLYCTRCRQANYCSHECQHANWTMHKEFCDKLVDLNASWESRKQP